MEEYEEQEKQIVYLDEIGFAQDMPRQYGYSPIGSRCYGSHDWHSKGRINVIGAIVNMTFVTLGMFSSSINSDVFYAWLTQDLLPKLTTGTVIVMDNATFHKRSDMLKAITEHGCIAEYLPPYSPDLNPIERCFSYYKKYLLRHSRLFARRPKEAHRRALCCVSGKTMRNLYNGKALQGAIKHVYTEEDEQTAVVLGAVVAALVCD